MRRLRLSLLLLLWGAAPAAGQITVEPDGRVYLSTTNTLPDATQIKLYVPFTVGAAGNMWYQGIRIQPPWNSVIHQTVVGLFSRVGVNLDVSPYQSMGWGFGAYFQAAQTGLFTGAYGNQSRSAVGVTAYAENGVDNYGIIATADANRPGWAGYFNGSIAVTGYVAYLSDRDVKQNVRDLKGHGVLKKVLQLQPRAYRHQRGGRFAHLSLPDGDHYGFVAQEVEQVFPELVKPVDAPSAEMARGAEGGARVALKSVNYTALIPLLVQALQEQEEALAALRVEVEAMKKGDRPNGNRN